MDTKKAAANSLYIIMFSQTASLFQTLLTHTVPKVDVFILLLMVAAGAVGGMIGGQVNKRIAVRTVERLFIGFMIVIIGINIYNLYKFVHI